MIKSDDTNKLIVSVLQIVNKIARNLEFHSNLVREKESNNCTLFASCWRIRT